jgi:hypothetical protein
MRMFTPSFAAAACMTMYALAVSRSTGSPSTLTTVMSKGSPCTYPVSVRSLQS